MVGRATLTMVESRNTIPDARITASRIQRACVPVTFLACVDTPRMVRPGGGPGAAATRSPR